MYISDTPRNVSAMYLCEDHENTSCKFILLAALGNFCFIFLRIAIGEKQIRWERLRHLFTP